MEIRVYRSWRQIGKELGKDPRSIKGKEQIINLYRESKMGKDVVVGMVLERDILNFFIAKTHKAIVQEAT